MSDLVKQLRALAKAEWMIGYGAEGNVTKAADRIEALEGEVAALKAERADNSTLAHWAGWKVRALAAEARAERLRVALEGLVMGLERTNWSSWQTTAYFMTPLEDASKALEGDKQ